ncbi:hypothetical protein MGN01_15090 [Methylobacterium gnaphalii]|uniref:Uncharacterized protein n=1 Tax=Methylobacterium gnaphalii TaxID=1010610 RepID=A0A512JI99_9HYPH|nr:hypothetical protein MGN01_15090 [Methylobacterium gnaphalii]GLS50082.1 hypothetical protein GCM10007885_29340 [Methylobacterium gnaphalii]
MPPVRRLSRMASRGKSPLRARGFTIIRARRGSALGTVMRGPCRVRGMGATIGSPDVRRERTRHHGRRLDRERDPGSIYPQGGEARFGGKAGGAREPSRPLSELDDSPPSPAAQAQVTCIA